MFEPCLVMLGELASNTFAERQHRYSRIDIYAMNRFVKRLDPAAELSGFSTLSIFRRLTACLLFYLRFGGSADGPHRNDVALG
jgi:hypothetical protein